MTIVSTTTIMTPHPYFPPPTTNFLPHYSVLNPPENSYINERHSTTLDIEIEKKKYKCGKHYIYHGLLSQEWIDRRY